MIFRIMRPFYFSFLVVFFTMGLLQAQQKAAPLTTQDVAAVSLTGNAPPTVYYVGADGRYQEFIIGSQNLSSINKVPVASTLDLFQKVLNDKGELTYTPGPRLALPDAEPGAMHLVVFYLQQDGRSTYKVLRRTFDSHKPGSVQLANLTASDVACKISGEVITLSSGDYRAPQKQPPVGEQFPFGFAYRQAGGAVLTAPTLNLQIPNAEMRLLIIFTLQADESAPGLQPQLTIRAIRLYDRASAPPVSTGVSR